LVNFVFNMLGLFLTSEGGASLNAISYSMLLPLTTLSNSLPLLGKFRENLQVRICVCRFVPKYHCKDSRIISWKDQD